MKTKINKLSDQRKQAALPTRPKVQRTLIAETPFPQKNDASFPTMGVLKEFMKPSLLLSRRQDLHHQRSGARKKKKKKEGIYKGPRAISNIIAGG